jgi:hypothetical protein
MNALRKLSTTGGMGLTLPAAPVARKPAPA